MTEALLVNPAIREVMALNPHAVSSQFRGVVGGFVGQHLQAMIGWHVMRFSTCACIES